VTSNGLLIFVMGSLFLFLGYMGVPVAFSLIAAVLVVTAFTPVSYASMMAQLFNGMDVEALVAIPFFLLVGDLMTSANVTVRMIRLAQSMVGHLRGGLAQVVTLFSMFFAGIRRPPTSPCSRARLGRRCTARDTTVLSLRRSSPRPRQWPISFRRASWRSCTA